MTNQIETIMALADEYRSSAFANPEDYANKRGALKEALEAALKPNNATGWIAPKDHYAVPVLFNPYTGEPRDVRDVQSDPHGILIIPPGRVEMLAALPRNSDAKPMGQVCGQFDQHFQLSSNQYAAQAAQPDALKPGEPLPGEVTEEMHQAACKVLLRANGLDGTPQRMLDAMRATAPPAQTPPRLTCAKLSSIFKTLAMANMPDVVSDYEIARTVETTVRKQFLGRDES